MNEASGLACLQGWEGYAQFLKGLLEPSVVL